MKYLLLTPLTPELFSLDTFEEIEEALMEFACETIYSTDTEGNMIAFAVGSTKKILENLCTTVDLEGTAVEISGVYDQMISLR